ncbi:unnamed protein product, partial [Rotaria sp. Silwood2]
AESPQQTSLPSNGSNDILSECYDQPSAAVVIAANDEFKRYLQSTDTLVDNEDLLTFWKQQYLSISLSMYIFVKYYL